MNKTVWKFSWPQVCLTLACVLVTTGCMSQEDRVRQVVERGVERCRSAEGDFFDVTLFDGTKKTVLREACLEELAKPELRTEWTATVNTGPILWLAAIDKGTSAWVLTDAQWEDLDRARRLRSDRDAPADVLARAENYLKGAQEAFPSSHWIRLERMQNILELRAKSRAADDPEPETIGAAAQSYYEELLAYAREQGHGELAAGARVMVIEHLQTYRRRQQAGLDSIGSQDEWLEKSIQEAIKEGERQKAREIQQDLDARRARAVTDRVVLAERIAKVQANLCEEATALTATGVSNEELRARVVELRGSIACSAAQVE